MRTLSLLPSNRAVVEAVTSNFSLPAPSSGEWKDEPVSWSLCLNWSQISSLWLELPSPFKGLLLLFPFSTAKQHLAGLSNVDISSSCISSVSAFLVRLSSPASLTKLADGSVLNKRRVSSPQLISESVSLSVLSSGHGTLLSESVPWKSSRMSLEVVWLASSLFDLTSCSANLFSSCWGTSSLLYFLLLCSLSTNLSTVESVSCNIWLSSASSGRQQNGCRANGVKGVVWLVILWLTKSNVSSLWLWLSSLINCDWSWISFSLFSGDIFSSCRGTSSLLSFWSICSFSTDSSTIESEFSDVRLFSAISGECHNSCRQNGVNLSETFLVRGAVW